MANRHSGRRQGPGYNDLGIVLRSHKLGESDKILRVLTREHGKRSAVAKGIRKTTSRFGARLEPLTCARLLMYQGRSMDTVTQAEIDTSFSEVREDLDLFVYGSAMAELVDSITQEHEPHPEIFDLLRGALQALIDAPRLAMFNLAFFEFRVLATAGFELRVESCAGCGRVMEPADLSFSLHLGGFICENCRGKRSRESGRLLTLSRTTRDSVVWMADHGLGEMPSTQPDVGTMRELSTLMDKVVEHWMERESRSRRVLRELPGH